MSKSISGALEAIRKGAHGSSSVTRIALKGLGEAVVESGASRPEDLLKELMEYGNLLIKARPSSILLSNGIRHVLRELRNAIEEGYTVDQLRTLAAKEAEDFIAQVDNSIDKISEIGARRLRDGDIILTHGYSSTVLAILRRAHREGKDIQVMVTETRPDFQGRLVAKDLVGEGVPTTLIIDSAVSHFMKDVDKVLVGAEAVAANGAVVNKVGTATIASVAHGARVRVFVAASTLKFSPETMLGELIEIEERDLGQVVSPEVYEEIGNVSVRNPAFDVTHPAYVDLIITERGVMPPQGAVMIITEYEATP